MLQDGTVLEKGDARREGQQGLGTRFQELRAAKDREQAVSRAGNLSRLDEDILNLGPGKAHFLRKFN